jgi:signal transduction histidine kinase
MASPESPANSARSPIWDTILAERHPLFGYGLAAAGTGIGLGLDAAMSGILMSHTSFIPQALVALTAIACGHGPGLFAALLSTLGLYFFFWAPASGVWNALGVVITFAPIVLMVAWGGGTIRALYQHSLRKEAELKLAVEERDEIMSVLSQDFRTHLSTFKINHRVLRILMDSLGPQIDKAFVERFDRADRDLSRLTTLIDNVIEVSKSKSGHQIVHREEFDLSDLAREIADSLSTQVEHAKCALDADLRSAVGKWDRLRLERVLLNLLANAITYAPGSDIALRTYTVSGRAKLVVEDHGPGIPEDKLRTLFQPPERLQDTTDRRRGTGLGLYVAKKIVDAHGGKIDARSQVGVGSVFTVDLPLYDS